MVMYKKNVDGSIEIEGTAAEVATVLAQGTTVKQPEKIAVVIPAKPVVAPVLKEKRQVPLYGVDWTREQLQAVKDMFPELARVNHDTDAMMRIKEECSRQIGRTTKAIEIRMYKLGWVAYLRKFGVTKRIRHANKNRPWTTHQLTELWQMETARRLLPTGKKRKKEAKRMRKHFGRTACAIKAQLNALRVQKKAEAAHALPAMQHQPTHTVIQ